MSIITDEDVYQYACCTTKYYNNHFNPISDDNESLYMSHIQQMIEEHRKKISNSICPTIISDASKNNSSETNKLIKKGENSIQGGLLLTSEFRAEPFILEKINKSSRLGKHSYQVVDFIPSIQFNEEYKKKLAFQSYLLYFQLGFMPSNCRMINVKQEIHEFNPVTIFEEVRNIVNGIKKIEHTKEKPVACINQHCKICRWKNKCLSECLERKDLSLLFGITIVTRAILNRYGINRMEQITRLSPDKIELLKNEGIRNIQFLIRQANSYISKKVEWITSPKFPKRYIALYFDIEGQIDLNFQYLFGIYNEETLEYKFFLADDITDEKDAFLALIKYLVKIKKYTLFHYGSYEKTVIRELCFKYNIPTKTEQTILNSTVDIYSALKKCAAIPIPSYSLKDVAKFLSLEWHDKDALGVNSIIWHNNWLTTNDVQSKERIIQYNKDDCKATKFVKEWLENTSDQKNGK